MYWIKEMQNAIGYIENRLLDELDIEDIAKSANSSSANFQRIFSIVTGMTVGEYVRARRLSLAAQELVKYERKALDIALKYGYETAESFIKAFSRFHGVTPSDVMRRNSSIKYFVPLSIKVYIKGGFDMSRKIIPNIPEIDFYGNEVDYAFNVLQAIFKIIGKEIDKSELAVYSGMGNRFCWTPGKWGGTHGNEAINCIDETPFETEIRLIKTLGWEAKYISVLRDDDGKPLNTDNEQIRRDFIDSIDRGYPVLTQDVHGHRHIIVIGYEDDGRKIISKDSVPFTIAVHKKSETVVRENWVVVISSYIILKEETKLTS